MKRLILFLIVLAAIAEGCKRYPDGPWLSLRTAEGRLYGTHTLTKYTVNGVDSLSLYQDSLCTSFNLYLNTDDGKNYCSMAGSTNKGLIIVFHWTWVLENKNTVLNVTSSVVGVSGTGLFKNNVCPEWQILKLYHDDVIMQTIYNGKQYLIELTGD